MPPPLLACEHRFSFSSSTKVEGQLARRKCENGLGLGLGLGLQPNGGVLYGYFWLFSNGSQVDSCHLFSIIDRPYVHRTGTAIFC